jgi:hypothetical protein
MITDNAPEKIDCYNRFCVYYNLVANGVYKAHSSSHNLFGIDFIPYLVAALISFDLGRMMGQGLINRYDLQAGGFARRLQIKLEAIEPKIKHLCGIKLCDADFSIERANIKDAYNRLALGEEGGLHQQGKEFHVGATKIFHFINPDLFLIIDSNAARAFRNSHNINFRNSTQPGYSAEKYLDCLEFAQRDINNFGVNNFSSLERGSPMSSIYDKLSFVTGNNWTVNS